MVGGGERMFLFRVKTNEDLVPVLSGEEIAGEGQLSPGQVGAGSTERKVFSFFAP